MAAMKTYMVASRLVAALTTCLLSYPVALAQTPSCGEISALARMARERSSARLTEEKRQVGESYRAQVVFAARRLELRSNDQSAAILLLNLIPKDDGQQAIWMTLGDSLC